MDNQKKGGDAEYPDHPRIAVGAVVFKEGQVLLVRRANSPAKGVWAIPGGRVELGERLQEAAEREIREETGIVIQAGQPVYTFDVIERDMSGRIQFHYVIIDLAAVYVSGTLKPDDDASDARWVSARELADLEINPKTHELLMTVYGFGEACSSGCP